jgi:hypothetical protein
MDIAKMMSEFGPIHTNKLIIGTFENHSALLFFIFQSVSKPSSVFEPSKPLVSNVTWVFQIPRLVNEKITDLKRKRKVSRDSMQGSAISVGSLI